MTDTKAGNPAVELGLAKSPETSQSHMVSYPPILIYDGRKYPFNPNKIYFHDPKPSMHGGYMIKQEYQLTPTQRVPIILQTPVMRTMWGISEKSFDPNSEARASLDLSFAGKETSKELEAFYDVMVLWDAVILQTAIKRKSSWFKDKNLSNEILQYLYHAMVRKNEKRSTDGTTKTFPESLRLRVQKRYDRLEMDVFDKDSKQVELSTIKRDMMLRVLFQTTGIWFTSKSWCSSNRALQAKIKPNDRLTGYGFIEDPSEEPKPMMVDDEPGMEEAKKEDK